MGAPCGRLLPPPPNRPLCIYDDNRDVARNVIFVFYLLISVVSRALSGSAVAAARSSSSLEKLSPEDIALHKIILGKITFKKTAAS